MKYLNRSKLKLSVLMLLSSIATSCADAGGNGEGTDNGEPGSYSSMDEYLTELADDYLFKQASADEKAILLENIRSLTPEDTRQFHRIVIERAGLTGNERRGAEIAAAYAEENGISLLDARHERHGEALRARLRAELTQSEDPGFAADEKQQQCGFGKVPCNFVTFWNSSLANGTCTTGCVNGTLYDRTGNEACEYGACDYRIRFTKAPATRIDGNTLAADCVLAYYSALLSYTGAPYTYAVIGQGGIVACFLPTGSIHTLFKVW